MTDVMARREELQYRAQCLFRVRTDLEEEDVVLKRFKSNKEETS